MQTSIHPVQHTTNVICTCGNKFIITSSINKKDMHVEHCFKCHPAYTGKRKISRKGAVEQFEKKFKAYSKSISKSSEAKATSDEKNAS